jgi:hypothetical protein
MNLGVYLWNIIELQMKTQITKIFSEVAHEKLNIDAFIKAIKECNLGAAPKYAYQAFCCALLAKHARALFQKGKYIKEYAAFINKALLIDANCIEARLIRLLVEKKLEDVSFNSFAREDALFLTNQVSFVEDKYIKELILKAISND